MRMKLYIDQNDVNESVKYFKNAGFSSEHILDIFLMSKHLGITESRSITYKFERGMSQKEKVLRSLCDLGGLIGDGEYFENYSLVFPNSFMISGEGSNRFYQPGTKLSGTPSRIKDTYKNGHNFGNIFVSSNGSDDIVLSKNYQEIIQSNLINNKKISLYALASWIFRFKGFEFKEKKVTETTFTRVVRRAIYKYFNITNRDLSWLFEDDLVQKVIHFSEKPISGDKFRELTGTKDIIEEKNESLKIDTDDKKHQFVHPEILDKEYTTKYSQLTGDNPSIDTVFRLLKNRKQIILTGVPGVGKSMYTNKISQKKFFEKAYKVQFHANYTYEDFIGGYVFENNSQNVKSKKGVFLSAIENAKSNPNNNFLFIIDEINRGNIAAILGETILALDREYTVKLAKEIDGVSTLSIPENLYIIATMNTSDRNIAFLDMAIRRRFSFVKLVPNYDFLSETIQLSVNTSDGDVQYNLGAILDDINQQIIRVTRDPEKILGQSYFIPSERSSNKWKEEEFHNQFLFGILPTIREYNYQKSNADRSILGDLLCDDLLDKDRFYEAFNERFGEYKF